MDNEEEILSELKKTAEQLKKTNNIFSDMARKSFDHSRAGEQLRRDMYSNFQGRFSKASDKMAESVNKAARASNNLDRVNQGVVNAIGILGKDVNVAAEALQGFSRVILGGFLGGAFVAGIMRWSQNLTGTYRELTEYGQSFSGGILEMARTAYQGNMSLDEFARVVKGNSVTLAQLSGNSGTFSKLSSDVRKASERFGLYGYTIEGINDLMLNQLDLMRLNGISQNFDHQRVSENLQGLARDTSFLSVAFGKSRAEITEASKRAQTDSLYTAHLLSKSAAARISEQEKYSTAITFMAAQAGEAGNILSSFLTQTVGSGGIAVYTDAFKNLFTGMLPEAAGAMERFVGDLEKGLSREEAIVRSQAYIQELNNMLDAETMDRLRTLRMNESTRAQADALIQFKSLIAAAADINLEDAKKKFETSSKYTQHTLAFATQWQRLTTALQYTFTPLIIGPLEALATALERLNSGGGIDKLTGSVNNLVAKIEAWAQSFLTEDSLRKAQSFVENMMIAFGAALSVGSFALNLLFGEHGAVTYAVKTASAMAPVFSGFASGFAATAEVYFSFVEKIGQLAGDVGGWAVKLLEMISITTDLSGVLSGFGKAVGAVAATFLALKGVQKLYGLMMAPFRALKSVAMRATTVYVAGKVIGEAVGKRFGRRGRDDGDKPSGRGGRGRRLRGAFGKVASVGGSVAGSAMMFGSDVISAATDALSATGDKIAKGAGAAAASAASTATEIASKGPAAAARMNPAAFLKGLGIVGTALTTVDAGMDAYELYKRKESGELSAEQFRDELIKLLTPKLSGAAGALALGALGAGAGTMVAPGLGSAAGGLVGGVAGLFGGEYIGEKIADAVVQSLATPTATPTSDTVKATPDTNLLTKNDLSDSQKTLQDKLSNLEQKSEQTPSVKELVDKLSAIEAAIKEQTAVNAQLSNRDYRESIKNAHKLNNSLTKISQ